MLKPLPDHWILRMPDDGDDDDDDDVMMMMMMMNTIIVNRYKIVLVIRPSM